ncbi:MAG: metal ABC transporter solute-binding protein, Zn/Mn family [Solirubrobacterales bacterium]
MKIIVGFMVGLLTLVCLMASGCTDRGAAGGYEIAVTNSYLECAVRDLRGQDAAVLCLAAPGMCPGHFDVSPAQVRQLKGCKLLLRFEFQQGIEQRLERMREGGLSISAVRPSGGLCVPGTYMAICRQVCTILSRTYPSEANRLEARLVAIEQRKVKLAAELRDAVVRSGVAGAAVLTSNHQAEFAQWLGLDSVATFVGSDTETVANIDHCLQKAAGRDVRFVIANQQEGVTLAQALAERCKAKAVVFSNFPLTSGQEAGFDQLLRDNVRLLCEAVTR